MSWTTEQAALCSLKVGDRTFGIETRQIREVLGSRVLQQVPLVPSYIGGIVPYRGEVLTTVSLRALLGLPDIEGVACVLVMEVDGDAERFGLLADSVGGVVVPDEGSLAENPMTLDARGRAMFDGAYRMTEGLLVRLDPRRLRPDRLAESGLF